MKPPHPVLKLEPTGKLTTNTARIACCVQEISIFGFERVSLLPRAGQEHRRRTGK